MFGSSTVVAFPAPAQVANPLPKPRPLDAASPDTKLDSRMLDSKPVNSANEPKPSLAAKPVEQRAADPVGNLLKAPAPPASPATTGAVARPPAAIPNATRTDPLGDLITNTRRVAAVQRALTEYGYGQLQADRQCRLGHSGCDPALRARAQAAGDRAGVRSHGARTRHRHRARDRLAASPAAGLSSIPREIEVSIWVAAYLRCCQTEGTPGAARRRGAEEAGAAFVKVALLDGTAMLYTPAPQSRL